MQKIIDFCRLNEWALKPATRLSGQAQATCGHPINSYIRHILPTFGFPWGVGSSRRPQSGQIRLNSAKNMVCGCLSGRPSSPSSALLAQHSSVSEKRSSFSFGITEVFFHFQFEIAPKPEKLATCGFLQFVGFFLL